MSGIAGLFNVPADPEQLATWSGLHMAHHRDCIRVVYEVLKIALPEYMLDPFDPKDLGQWPDLHQQMHNQMNAILGVSGLDLLDPDFTDRGKLQGWIDFNAVEHREWADILEIG